jgi:hypothetical protein
LIKIYFLSALRNTRILTSDESSLVFSSVAIGGNDGTVGFTTTFTDAVLSLHFL